jgi:hypothetical protein
MKTITIKLTKASNKTGPFTIKDNWGNIIALNVPKEALINGMGYSVEDDVTIITLESNGKCTSSKTKPIGIVSSAQLMLTTYTQTHTACLWKHLTFNKFNNYYGNIEPYIIEYPVDYQPLTEILQNIQIYDKVYKYFDDSTGVFNYSSKIEIDNEWFSHAVVYNNQQSTGVLKLVAKPLNNLHEYMKYPIYNNDSKSIIYTKSDNSYQFNTLFNIVKDKSIPLFTTSCESLSVDKIPNQTNLIYASLSFKKDQLRAKDCKIRMILSDKSDIHIVSQFIITSSMISYK